MAILIIANTSDHAADHVVHGASCRGIPCVRINLDALEDCHIAWHPDGGVAALHAGTREILGSEITGVYCRRVTLAKSQHWVSDFTSLQWAALFNGLEHGSKTPWINPPALVASAEIKPYQLALARSVGLAVPATLITNKLSDATNFVASGPTVAKAVMSGSGTDDDGSFFTPTIAIAVDDLDHGNVSAAPTIYQRRIATSADLRATIVDNEVFGARIAIDDRGPHDVDWRTVDTNRLVYDRWAPLSSMKQMLVALNERLGLRYSAVDLVESTDGQLYFLELNPAGQWGWLEHHLGYRITNSIVERLTEREVD